jgi:hypothetical protein
MRDDINTSGCITAGPKTTLSAAQYCSFCNDMLPFFREALTLRDPVRNDPLRFCDYDCLHAFAQSADDGQTRR